MFFPYISFWQIATLCGDQTLSGTLNSLETRSDPEPCGRQRTKMIPVAKIIKSAKVELRIRVSAFFTRRLVKNFPAQSERLSYLTLQKPAGEPPVLIVFSRVDPVAATA